MPTVTNLINGITLLPLVDKDAIVYVYAITLELGDILCICPNLFNGHDFSLATTKCKRNNNCRDDINHHPDNCVSFSLVGHKCNSLGVKIISATSAGNKLDPLKFQVADIYKTTVCPVCKILRKELKARGIKKHKVVFSTEEPAEQKKTVTEGKKRVLGSISFVPSVAGLIIAGEVIKDLVE